MQIAVDNNSQLSTRICCLEEKFQAKDKLRSHHLINNIKLKSVD